MARFPYGTFGGFRSSSSSSTRAPIPSCFRHRSKVIIGANRAPGRLMRCESKQPGKGEYWKVLLDSGEWVWPDVMILATPGEHVATCEAGGGRFLTDQTGDGLLCPKHDGEIFGTAADHAIDAAAPRPPGGNSHKWKPGRRS